MQNTSLSIGVVILIVLFVLFFGGVGMMGFGGFGRGPGMMNGGMMGGAFNPLGGVLSLIVGAIVIGGIGFVAVSLGRSNNVMTPIAPPRESPLDVLRVRYAHGRDYKGKIRSNAKGFGGMIP